MTGGSYNPLFPRSSWCLLTFCHTRGRKIIEINAKNVMNHNTVKGGQRAEERKLELLLVENRETMESIACICIFGIIFHWQARSFWVSYPPHNSRKKQTGTRGATAASKQRITSHYSIHTEHHCAVCTHSHRQRESNGGMLHQPSYPLNRGAKKRQVPKLAMGWAWRRMWPRKLFIEGTSDVLLFSLWGIW